VSVASAQLLVVLDVPFDRLEFRWKQRLMRLHFCHWAPTLSLSLTSQLPKSDY